MIQSPPSLSRAVLATLVVAPLGIMVILTVTVLWPTLRNSESNIYSSSIGYPSLKRLVGQPIKVQTVPLALKNLEDSIAAPGESVALQDVNVSPLVSGTVEQVYVVEGERVRRGQPLLRLQQSPFEDAVNRARNDVATAELNLQTLPKLQQKQLVELKANIESAKAKLPLAESSLRTLPKLQQEQLVELKANLENAKARLAIAKEKFERLRLVAKEGGLAQSALSEAQDSYTTRQNDLVTAQQELARAQINNTDLNNAQDSYTTRQNDLVTAQQELARVQSSMAQEIEAARLTLENNKIALRQAIRDLNNTVLYASTDGLVSQVNIHSGELANEKTSIITLTQDIVFKAYIDQARLNTIKIGDQATVRLVAYPGRTFQGKVTQLNPTVQTDVVNSGKVGTDRQYTYSAWITVDGLQMPPGLQGYAQFGQSKTTLVIPENAVTHLSGGEGMVMVAEGGQAVVKRVKLGRVFDNQRQVLEGLRAGEQVVLSPRALNPGDRLKILISQEQERETK